MFFKLSVTGRNCTFHGVVYGMVFWQKDVEVELVMRYIKKLKVTKFCTVPMLFTNKDSNVKSSRASQS